VINTEFQAEVFTTLSTDSDLMDLVDGVYGNVPNQTREINYITIGDDDISDFGAHDIDGFEVTCTIHAWVRERGRLHCHKVLKRVYELMHKKHFDLSQKSIVSRFNFSNIIIDPDNRTHHGVIRFTITFGG